MTVTSEVGVGTKFTIDFPWEPAFYPYWVPRKSELPRIAVFIKGVITTTTTTTKDFCGFYGLSVDAFDVLEDLRGATSYSIILIRAGPDGAEEGVVQAFLEENKFEWAVVGVLVDPGVRIPVRRTTERFVRPLCLSAFRKWLIELVSGRIAPDTSFHRRQVSDALGLRVLAADDNATNQFVLRQILTKIGCLSTIVGDGTDVVNRLEAGEVFDVVILDQQMPVLGGLETVQWIRKNARVSEIPVVAMTASNAREDIDAWNAAGADEFICKPVPLKKLARVLDRVVTARRQPLAAEKPEDFD
jgi:CheY-like chemotaxis protein